MREALATSEKVPIRGVEDVEVEGQPKRVTDATVHLEERHGPSPPRRVVCMTTADNAVYRFQRYGRDEPLQFYNREKEAGEPFSQNYPLPRHVKAVRDAIEARDVLPEFEAMIEAERAVGFRPEADDQVEDVTDDWPSADSAARTGSSVRADGGEQPRLGRLARGRPVEKAARKKRTERRLDAETDGEGDDS